MHLSKIKILKYRKTISKRKFYKQIRVTILSFALFILTLRFSIITWVLQEILLTNSFRNNLTLILRLGHKRKKKQVKMKIRVWKLVYKSSNFKMQLHHNWKTGQWMFNTMSTKPPKRVWCRSVWHNLLPNKILRKETFKKAISFHEENFEKKTSLVVQFA